MFYPWKHNPTKSKPSFLRLLAGRGQTQQCTHSTTHTHLPLLQPYLSSLYTNPFTTPFSASCTSLSRSKQSTTKDASPTTNCQKFARGKGNFFEPNHQKKRETLDLLVFLTQQIPNHRNKSFWQRVLVFSFIIVFSLNLLVIDSQQQNYTTDKTFGSSYIFFMSFFGTFYTFNLTESYYSSLTRSNDPILYAIKLSSHSSPF